MVHLKRFITKGSVQRYITKGSLQNDHCKKIPCKWLIAKGSLQGYASQDEDGAQK